MNWDILIAALIMIESSGINTAIGDNGESVGCLQIQMPIIQDVNRVYKTRYTSYDRYDRKNSTEICKLYLKYWSSVYSKRTNQPATYEILARIWNGGPYGYKKEDTKRYWNKVQKQL